MMRLMALVGSPDSRIEARRVVGVVDPIGPAFA